MNFKKPKDLYDLKRNQGIINELKVKIDNIKEEVDP
jgi:hypothetical protein